MDAALTALYLDDAEKRHVVPPALRAEIIGQYCGEYRTPPRRVPKGKHPRDMTPEELEAMLPLHPGVTMELGGREMLAFDLPSFTDPIPDVTETDTHSFRTLDGSWWEVGMFRGSWCRAPIEARRRRSY